jgi:isopentenyl phosphate kinase
MSISSSPVVLVKLGGSLITDKRRPATARPAVLRRLAREIAGALFPAGTGGTGPALRLVVGHGSGSFGHVAAARAGLHRGPLAREDRATLAGITATQTAARDLHRRVVAALDRAGALPFSIAPGAALFAATGRPAAFAVEPVALALALGLTPVVFGDVVLDREWGAAIASTEAVFAELAARLARWRDPRFRVTRAIWAGATDGVYDRRGRTVAEVTAANADAVRAAARGAAGTDVTGGMLHRLDTALALAAAGVESWIVDGTVRGRLARVLAGEPVPGTRVPAPAAGKTAGAEAGRFNHLT